MTALLTIAQTAAALTVSRSTVYAEIARGRLKAIAVARLYRVDPAEVARYKRDNEVKPAAVPAAQTVRGRPARLVTVAPKWPGGSLRVVGE